MKAWIVRLLAAIVGLFSRRRRAMLRALNAKVAETFQDARRNLYVRAGVYVDSLGAPSEAASLAALVTAVHEERNAFLQYIELTKGLKARWDAESLYLQSFEFTQRSAGQTRAPAPSKAWACSAHGVTEQDEPCCKDAIGVSPEQVEQMLQAAREEDERAKRGA